MKSSLSSHISRTLLLWLSIASLIGLQTVAAGCGGKEARAEELAANKKAAEKAAQKVSTTLPTGTEFMATLETSIATDKNHVGDQVSLRIVDPISRNGRTIVPTGAVIKGDVTHIDPAGSVAGGAEITLRFNQLAMGGNSYPITCEPFRLWVTGDAQESVLAVSLSDGTRLWEYPWQSRASPSAITPILYDDTLIVSSQSMGVTALKPSRRSTRPIRAARLSSVAARSRSP